MDRKPLAARMEWIQPAGIRVPIFAAFPPVQSPAARFHVLGTWVTMLVCGTVASELLALGSVAPEKVGDAPNRAYQVQSGPADATTAGAALLVYLSNWRRFADAAIPAAMLLCFGLSGADHPATAATAHSMQPANLLRPEMALLLAGLLVHPMIQAVAR